MLCISADTDEHIGKVRSYLYRVRVSIVQTPPKVYVIIIIIIQSFSHTHSSIILSLIQLYDFYVAYDSVLCMCMCVLVFVFVTCYTIARV